MNDPIQKLKMSADEVRLSPEAYGRMRESLAAHIAAHPASVPSPYHRWFSHARRPLAASTMMAVLAMGGATAYASKGSLPGDPLYPVKVKVVEPVQGLLAVTPAAKAAWQASVASERLSEAAELAKRHKLTPEETKQSDERFSKSLEAAQASIDSLSENDPEEAVKIRASLSDTLKKHEQTLIAGTATSTDAGTLQFAGKVKAEIESLHDGRDTKKDGGRDKPRGQGSEGD